MSLSKCEHCAYTFPMKPGSTPPPHRVPCNGPYKQGLRVGYRCSGTITVDPSYYHIRDEYADRYRNPE